MRSVNTDKFPEADYLVGDHGDYSEMFVPSALMTPEERAEYWDKMSEMNEDAVIF